MSEIQLLTEKIETLEKTISMFFQYVPVMNYSVSQAAKILCVSTSTIRVYCENYELNRDGIKLSHHRSSEQANSRLIITTKDIIDYQMQRNNETKKTDIRKR